jgi:hypothetical protein
MKTSLHNKSKFITDDYILQHVNITINKVLSNEKPHIKGNYVTSLITSGSLNECSSSH